MHECALSAGADSDAANLPGVPVAVGGGPLLGPNTGGDDADSTRPHATPPSLYQGVIRVTELCLSTFILMPGALPVIISSPVACRCYYLNVPSALNMSFDVITLVGLVRTVWAWTPTGLP